MVDMVDGLHEGGTVIVLLCRHKPKYIGLKGVAWLQIPQSHLGFMVVGTRIELVFEEFDELPRDSAGMGRRRIKMDAPPEHPVVGFFAVGTERDGRPPGQLLLTPKCLTCLGSHAGDRRLDDK